MTALALLIAKSSALVVVVWFAALVLTIAGMIALAFQGRDPWNDNNSEPGEFR